MNRRNFFKSALVGSGAVVTSAIAASPAPKIKSKQKFLRGQRVRIGEMPPWMRHFEHNTDAIVVGSYRDQYGHGDGKSHQQYTLLLFNQDGTIHGTCSWYLENQLTLIDSDRDKGEQIIQSHCDKDE
jgi:hypothetical protein